MNTMNVIEAAEQNDVDTLQQLIEAGKHLNKFYRGVTPLMAAAANSCTEAVELLIKAGVDVDLADDGGTTALMCAAMHGYDDIVRLLVNSGTDIHVRDKKGYCALLHAVKFNLTDIMSFLLKCGASPNTTLPNGATALDIAIGSGYIEATEFLINSGADPNLTQAMQSRKAAKTATWLNETVPLLAATEREDLTRIKQLLAAGVNPDVHDTWGETALIKAARLGNDEIVEELVKSGAQINTPDNGRTALAEAVLNDNLSTIRCLLAHGADLTAMNKRGMSILDLAVSSGSESMIELLLSFATEHGVKLDTTRAAEHAARRGHEHIVAMLSQPATV